MDGMIVIRKEKGYTSHDVVAKLRGILHMKKIGHTGTLDPDAEGVLPVALGKATRLVDLITDKEKTYEAVMRLGVVTDTQDMSGTVRAEYHRRRTANSDRIFCWGLHAGAPDVFGTEGQWKETLRTCQRGQDRGT